MDAMARIRAKPGELSRLAKALGITRGAVSVWKRVPASRLGDVARLTGIPAEELRPDLAAQFDRSADTTPEAA